MGKGKANKQKNPDPLLAKLEKEFLPLEVEILSLQMRLQQLQQRKLAILEEYRRLRQQEG